MTPRPLPFHKNETDILPADGANFTAEAPALSVIPGGLAPTPARKKTLAKIALPRVVKKSLPVDHLGFCADGRRPRTSLPWTRPRAACSLLMSPQGTRSPADAGATRYTAPVKPETVATYHRILRTFFLWLVAERFLDASPLETIKTPIARRDQIEPLTTEQVESLLLAAKKSREAPLNEAILMLLWNTGIRVSEMCGLRLRDLDMGQKSISVLGKGNKRRKVHFGKRCAKAIWNYVGRARGSQEGWQAAMDGTDFGRWDSDTPLFASEVGIHKGERLERNAVLLILKRLSKAAGVMGVRVTPHTMRHTFAVSFLRAGGSVFSLMEVLGHTDLKMSKRYVTFADADIASQGRFSPADAGRKV